jgi:Ca2+-binding EF-hand superfamily protein
MHANEALKLFSKLCTQILTKWPKFISELKSKADKDDESQIVFSEFINICRRQGGRLSKDEREAILLAFPGKEGG